MKATFIFAVMLCASLISMAQPDCTIPYYLSTYTETYEELNPETAYSITDENLWFGNSWAITIGFDFTYFGYSYSEISLANYGVYLGNAFAGNEELGVLVPFSPLLMDKGLKQYIENSGDAFDVIIDNIPGSESPISYEVIGAIGDRIFKLEWKNAAIEEEYGVFSDGLGSVDGTIGYQLWLYEIDGTIEYHFDELYDPHNVIDYPLSGLVCSIDFETEEYGDTYLATGNPENPSILQLPPNYEDDPEFEDVEGNLTSLPQSGRVFRWAATATGVEMVSSLKNQVYPNPFQDVINISCEETVEEIQLFNSEGRLVIQESPNDSFHSIDTANLERGVYLLTLRSKDQIATRKIIK